MELAIKLVEEKLLVRLSGAAADMLNELVKRGYFSTKSEAIRAGILKLGESFGILKPPLHYWKELGEEIRKTGRTMTREQLVEAIKRLEQET